MKHIIKFTGFKLALIAGLLSADYAVVAHKNSQTPSSRIPASVDAATTSKTFVFHYKDLSKKPFSIKKEASSYEQAYKQASKDCFEQLTGGKYPGEEKGLDIIDICANPKS